MHPYGTTLGVFKPSACEGEFNLINDFCWYETKSVSGIYQTFHNDDWQSRIETILNLIGFHVADAMFPRRMYFFLPQGDAC